MLIAIHENGVPSTGVPLPSFDGWQKTEVMGFHVIPERLGIEWLAPYMYQCKVKGNYRELEDGTYLRQCVKVVRRLHKWDLVSAREFARRCCEHAGFSMGGDLDYNRVAELAKVCRLRKGAREFAWQSNVWRNIVGVRSCVT